MNPATARGFRPRLLSLRDEAPGIRSFRFASPPGFAFTPGQFLLFHFADHPRTRRAYSLCSSPAAAGEHFEVTVGLAGKLSERLKRLEPGGAGGLLVSGPFGRWTYDGSPRHAVLVSGGTGVTPFRAMCLLKKDRRLAGRVTLLCSARTPANLLYRAEHEAWRRAGIAVRAVITRPQELGPGERWDGPVGRITAEDALKAAGDPAAVYFLCGPAKMVRELRDGLRGAGVPPEQVRTETWGDYSDLF